MYLKRSIITVLLILGAGFLIGKLFDHRYKTRWSTLFFDSTDTLTRGKTNYDILFLGNSRTHFGINPYYIDSITKSKSFNFGIGGADLNTIELVAATYLENHSAPKIVVIGIDEGMHTTKNKLKILYQFLYYPQSDSIHKYMQLAGFPMNTMHYIPFLKYAYFDEYNRTSIFINGNKLPVFGKNIYRGFVNVHEGLQQNNFGDFGKSTKAEFSFLPEQSLINTIQILQSKGTLVVFLKPPYRDQEKLSDSFTVKSDSSFNAIVKRYNIPVINLTHIEKLKSEYFIDDIHLNEPGSEIFSRQLADSLIHLLK